MDTNETTIYYAILITSLVIGSIILYFSITIFRNHRKHFKMLRRNFLAEMELLEKERNRIARDLHDELGPLLAVTQIHLSAMENSDKDYKLHLEKAEENIEKLSERFKGIAKNLTPKILVSKGLEAALREFTEQFEEITPIHTKLRYKIVTKLSLFHALHFYRIVQELVHNVVKHSGATRIEIQFAERKNKIYLSFTDNGAGLPKEYNPMSEMGLGLESLQNRVQMMGGKIVIESRPNTGTEYFFEIPIKQEHERAD